MATRNDRYNKLSPQERRAGESALSDFADYVQKQQAKRRHPQDQESANGTQPAAATEEHAELDILDSLNLSDEPTNARLKHLFLDKSDDVDESVSTLTGLVNGRLEDGHGEAMFDLGLEDNGDSMGFDKEDWDFALARLHTVTESLGADYRVLMTKNVGGEAEVDISPKEKACSGKLMIRRRPSSVDNVIETRIAVVGNVDAGKSTMLGVLVKGGLDDGRGKARVNLFRHKHEIESGRTSSVGMEIMGFDSKGEVVMAQTAGRKLSWEEIGNRSAKVIGFTDLAGHERYLRTTVFGMLSSEPNYCLLMVAANNGLIGMSKEHLGIALALNVPVMVCITKIDICPPQILQQTITQLTKILKSPGARKIPIFIKNKEVGILHNCSISKAVLTTCFYQECINTATQFISQRICPVFQVSNVTGDSLDLVRMFLNIIPHHGHYDAEAPFEFHINDTFSVPFVGTVVSGVVKSGVVHAGDTILVGPDGLGNFTTTNIRSIERKRIGVPACSAGQSASFALKKVRRKDVRKGMVCLLKNDDLPPKVHREFVAEVLILSHATTIKTKYQAMLHVGPISQTCAIIDIDRAYIRTGDRATVAFRFVQRPEFLSVGDRILFREGRTKGLGIVKAVGYDPSKPLNPDAGKQKAVASAAVDATPTAAPPTATV
ncbi:P-loop containing nucleoside triphosphate hydrolase protein [Aureobasidium subglaciale]|nr:P-loop containing nucleoside triphosphate hydrolase protein [Aureobasidium subglaciale]